MNHSVPIVEACSSGDSRGVVSLYESAGGCLTKSEGTDSGWIFFSISLTETVFTASRDQIWTPLVYKSENSSESLLTSDLLNWSIVLF